MFNAPPEPEHQFYMITIRARNLGERLARFNDWGLHVVGEARGVVYATFKDRCGVIPDGDAREMLPAFSFTMNVCWQIHWTDESTLRMFWDEGWQAEGERRVWFSLE